MLEEYAAEFFRFGSEIRTLERSLWHHTDESKKAPFFPVGLIVQCHIEPGLLDRLLKRCEALHLRVTADAIKTLQAAMIPNSTHSYVRGYAETVIQTAESELKTLHFMHVAYPKDERYLSPSKGWEETLKRFPEMTEDVEESEKCLALDRHTACVFHLMRVIEIAVQLWGTSLGVANPTEKEWGIITNEIKQTVEKLPDTTAAEKAHKTAMHEIKGHLDSLRWAWRNPTMHPKQSYKDWEAKEVIDRVRSFMNLVSRAI